MAKIAMRTPLVEIDGDEMTRVIWAWIKRDLLEPYIDLVLERYDLGLPARDRSDDRVTLDAAAAIRKHGVGVKCATITPNAQRVEEYSLKAMYKSPNATIRAYLDGTVFRTPILVRCVEANVKSWKAPITLARHAFGDVYKNTEFRVEVPGSAELVYKDADGQELSRQRIASFTGAGVLQAQYNTDESIASFARSCFRYALDQNQDLWFSTKDTISKTYDRRFQDLFQSIYDDEFAAAFAAQNRSYFYTLIDDAVARVMRSEGGFIWACKNYDGDVMSDMIASAYGSLAMMTSVLVSPDGCYEFEAAHGTVTRHYRRHQAGESTSTNCIATLFAWTGALRKRAQLDSLDALAQFAHKLEAAAIQTIEEGSMSADLVRLSTHANTITLSTEDFIGAIRSRLEAM